MSKDYLNEFDTLLKECDSIYHNYATALGLSDCALWILSFVHEKSGDVRQADICEHTYVSRQTVNSSLKKLERDGYLALSKIEGRMGKSIHLTSKGEEFAEKYIRPLFAAEQRAVSAFPDEELQSFLATLRRIVSCLGREIGKEQEGFANDR